MADDPVAKNESPCIALGVSSSIAAYKAAALTSQCVKAGMDVNVLMTENATRLVGPRTLLTLSRNPVITSLWDVPDWRPEHIALSQRARLLVIAPATANVLAKLATGIADDALTTFALAHEGPVIVAPAMNPQMWRHPSVRENCRILAERGVVFVDPEPGPVACGADAAPGRMAAVERIFRTIQVQLALPPAIHGKGAGRKLVVTAGPTREPLDPVRFLTNRSSGKMGYAVAEVAAAMGFETTIISGPVSLPLPVNCALVEAGTASAMRDAVMAEFTDATALVMCAAVADFAPKMVPAKIKKSDRDQLELRLQRTPDILAEIAKVKKPGQKVIGFAAESGDPVAEAKRKLCDKHLDLVVANDISRADVGFGSDRNQAALVTAKGVESLPVMSKIDLAVKILAQIA